MNQNDFSKGSIPKHVLQLAMPMIFAQFINVLYNIVDRIFIGRIPDVATQAMSGLGICLPIVTIIMAFANLVGMGGAPLSSIERGKGNNEKAEEIMGNSFTLLIILSVILMIVGFLFKDQILWLFGASSETFSYADSYMTIYLCGTLFVLLELGLNAFINAQGFGRIGMMTVLIGAVLNIILDPIFIFVLDMGVGGAALATVIAQFVSALWTLQFLTGKKTILKLRIRNMKLNMENAKKILSLGTAGFMQEMTNSIVTIVCNRTLSQYGGDVYIAIMTVINSIRSLAFLPANGLSNASQPVMGYNYGAQRYDRVLQTIKFTTIVSFVTMTIVWLGINLFPEALFSIFTSDAAVLENGIHACRLYFFGFFMMSLQSTGQAISIGLGNSKQAIFFSIFRKVIIVAPLTVILPRFIGVDGVFIAEAISNFIGGGACYITMWLTEGKELRRLDKQKQLNA